MKISKTSPKSASSKSTSSDAEGRHATDENEAIARGGVATPFPWKLHEMLEDASKEGNDWIVSWQSHGRSFIVHKPKIFVEKIMPTYFNQSKFASFQRQLNLYGFNRLTAGTDKGAYYHEYFIRGQRSLCRGMVRQKIKGTKVRRTLSPEEEPNFYIMSNISSSTSTTTPPPLELASEESPPTHHQEEDVEALSGKDRALQLRREQLETVRDVLEQTEQLCDEHSVEDDFDRRARAISCSVPSVSPVESEESDSEESHVVPTATTSSSSSHATYSMMSSPQPTPPQMLPGSSNVAPLLLEPRGGGGGGDDRFTPRMMMTSDEYRMKGGDLLFFEGKPFHYLEHLDAVPQVTTTTTFAGSQPNKQQNGFYQRDTLHSLMRMDPKSIMGSAC